MFEKIIKIFEKLSYVSDAQFYLVGTAASFLKGKVPEFNDVDVFCTKTPPVLFDYDFKINSFGAYKYKIGDINLDLWQDTLESYINKALTFSERNRNGVVDIYNFNKKIWIEASCTKN